MTIKIIHGNLFTSKCQTLVNTVNCVGVMGAGIALEYRLRYPEMYDEYVRLCQRKRIDIGVLWIYRSKDKWILNFPTKKHWKYPSRPEYLCAGLKEFLRIYQKEGIKSIAFPLLGADKGGIHPKKSEEIMRSYLEKADLEIEIYKYDKNAGDGLYPQTKKWMLSQDAETIKKITGLKQKQINKIRDAMRFSDISQLIQLGKIEGIGIVTLQKLFNLAQNKTLLESSDDEKGRQLSFME